MKKFLYLFVILLSVFLLVSCGKSDETDEPKEVKQFDLTDDIKCTFTDGVLEFSGKGKIPDYSEEIYEGYFLAKSILEKNLEENSSEIMEVLNDLGEGNFENKEDLLNYIIQQSEGGIIPWIEYNERIEKVVIGDGITSVGSYTFYNCANLSEIKIAGTVTEIGKGAFKNCSKLEKISIPKKLQVIEDETFYSCNSLKKIKIPDEVKKIGEKAFWNCYGITSISFESKIESIGYAAFENCTDLKVLSTIPKSVVKIGDRAFAGTSINKFDVHKENESYCTKDGIIFTKDMKTLVRFGKGTEKYTVPKETVKIGNYAFMGTDIKHITLHNGVTEIGKSSFRNCNNLEEITIPDSVKSIGSSCFELSKKLKKITLSSNIENVEDWTFKNCVSLEEINFPSKIKYIGKSAFNNCDSLTKVILPKGCLTLGDRAFYDCEALKKVYIPNSIQTGGNYPFLLCGNIETFYYEGSYEEWNERLYGVNRTGVFKFDVVYDCENIDDIYD